MLSNAQLAELYDSNDAFVPPVAPVATPAPSEQPPGVWTLYFDEDNVVDMEYSHVLEDESWNEEDEDDYSDDEEYLDEDEDGEDEEDDPCAGCTLCDPTPEEETTEKLLETANASVTEALRGLLGNNRVVVMINIIK